MYCNSAENTILLRIHFLQHRLVLFHFVDFLEIYVEAEKFVDDWFESLHRFYGDDVLLDDGFERNSSSTIHLSIHECSGDKSASWIELVLVLEILTGVFRDEFLDCWRGVGAFGVTKRKWLLAVDLNGSTVGCRILGLVDSTESNYERTLEKVTVFAQNEVAVLTFEAILKHNDEHSLADIKS